MILVAINIHRGGGKILLDRILRDKSGENISHVFSDERYPLPEGLDSSIKVIRVKPTIFSRLFAEWKLRALSKLYPTQKILSLTNMPPLFRLAGPTCLFLQNALLLPGHLKYCKSTKHLVKTTVEQIILRLFLRNLDEIFIQTTWMKEKVEQIFTKPIWIHPIPPEFPEIKNLEPLKIYDFIAVTGAIPYKNLNFLLQCWESNPELKRYNLVLVVDELSHLQQQKIEHLLALKFNVIVRQNISHDEVYSLYEQSKTLIVTSSIESYCLPLYEAQFFGLKIIAPQLPYVQDVEENILFFENLDQESFQLTIQQSLN